MAVTAQTPFVAHGLGHGLPKRDAHIFDRVVAVNVQVALALDVEVYQAMPGNLIEHMVKKTDAGRQLRLARAVKVELDDYFGLCRVAGDFGCAG